MAVAIAGDNMDAVRLTEKMVKELGFDPVFVGALFSADFFAAETPVYGVALTARKMKIRLNLALEERPHD